MKILILSCNTGEGHNSLPLPDDVPLSGHEALRDTMTDLILDLVGSLLVSIYVFLRYNKLMKMQQISFKE